MMSLEGETLVTVQLPIAVVYEFLKRFLNVLDSHQLKFYITNFLF